MALIDGMKKYFDSRPLLGGVVIFVLLGVFGFLVSDEDTYPYMVWVIPILVVLYGVWQWWKNRNRERKRKTIGEINREFSQMAKKMGIREDPETPTTLSDNWNTSFMKDKEK